MNRAEIVNGILERFNRQEANWEPAMKTLARPMVLQTVPLEDAIEVLRSMGETSLIEILKQRFNPP